MSVGFCQKNHPGGHATRTPGMELMLLCEVAIDKASVANKDQRDAKCVHSDLNGIVMLDIGMGDKLRSYPHNHRYAGGYGYGYGFGYSKHGRGRVTRVSQFEYSVPNVDQVLMRYLFQFEVLPRRA